MNDTIFYIGYIVLTLLAFWGHIHYFRKMGDIELFWVIMIVFLCLIPLAGIVSGLIVWLVNWINYLAEMPLRQRSKFNPVIFKGNSK